ncbi:L,D-transpeptidase family protein [Clostridium lacusfryxellense]|uniref:L,D-transpeptidase family protein n=1 Tax=Clostridium lacusfryxellense TaxID=205328 RepID=UPI001C0C6811|nr:L,D-transpeptidase family protein [Clostridium lacusfryxellense]MBU3109963.1 L,D-transpeptidase/peptidoglycan binding protein [Clostridium lacusfryxellense]
MEIQTTKRKKSVKAIIISFSILFALYLSFSIYFSNHFYFGSVINGVNASGKTVDKVDKELLTKYASYTLELNERGGVKEQLKAADIGLKYNSNGKVQMLEDNKNSFGWFYEIFNPKNSEISGLVTYDEKLLKSRFDKLSAIDSKKTIEPQNANFKYTDDGYVVVKEVMGNKITSKQLYTNIISAILTGETKMDLELKNNYVNPKYTSTSKEILATKILLNKYITSNITYTYASGNQVIDKSVLNKWLTVDKNNTIIFDEVTMKTYLTELDNHYETYGTEREFATSVGKTLKVGGGDYGWKVQRAGEVADLIVSIKSGQTIAKEPRYTEKGLNHDLNDIGNTYVEINMTKQHMWFYKNGNLIASGDVVTGKPTKDRATPTGIYKLKYKAKNATLKGENYSTPVSVFMPFNGGIGIHDATWRNKFGGQIYLTGGSHGCINSPPALAQKIYDNINADTPVVCYFE